MSSHAEITLADSTLRTAEERRSRVAVLSALWPGGHARAAFDAAATLVVGRSDDCDLRVDARSVSRQHVRVGLSPSPYVEDLGSANGTRVAGRPVKKNERVAISKDTLVQIGDAVLVLQIDGPEGDGPPPATDSPSPLAFERLVELAARSNLSILIRGETGVGKEVLATRIHAGSARASGPFIRVNCAALTETLFESELFGHEKGAFTGAVQARAGYFEAASGGTILLDEIGDLSGAMQVKLLRVLESREVVRVGATRPKPVDVRLLTATHQDLERMVEAGTFRSDLYYRIDGLSLTIPPLRDRPLELETLARTIAREAGAELSANVIEHLRSHRWPGNVRELRNVLERGIVLAAGQRVAPEHLRLSPAGASSAPVGAGLRDELAAVERQRIVDALARTHGNQSEAARLLDMPRRTLTKRITEYGLPRPRKPGS